MNLVLLHSDDFQEEHRARLFGERATHIREIHRVSPGDTLRVGLVGGPMGEGVVLCLDDKSVDLSVTWRECPPVPSSIELLVAMPRPQTLKKILAMITSVGVKRLVLISSARVEKSYFDSPLLSAASLQRELELGLAQGCDTILPQIVIRKRFKPFIEDELHLFWPSPTRKLLAHPEAMTDAFGVVPTPTKDPVVLAIGPEGGWIPFEVELLEAHGFQRFTAGPRILRVETAVFFLLGQLELLWGRSVEASASLLDPQASDDHGA
jgi:RsmE family RNA methyltransferase